MGCFIRGDSGQTFDAVSVAVAGDPTDKLGAIERYLRRQGLGALCERGQGVRHHERLEDFNIVFSFIAALVVILSIGFHVIPFSGWWFIPMATILVIMIAIGESDSVDQSQGARRLSRLSPVLSNFAPGLAGGAIIQFLLYWLALGFNWIAALLFVIVNIVIYAAIQLGAIFVLATAFPALARNAGQAVRNGLVGSLRAAARGLPLVFVVLIVLFVSSDAWRFVASSALWRFSVMVLLLVLLPGPFVMLWLREEASRLCALDLPAGAVASLAKRTPASALVGHLSPAKAIPRRAARFNIALALTVVVLVRILFVVLATSAVFVVLGAVGIEHAFAADLLHHDEHPIASVAGMTVSSELLRIAILLGVLAGALFAVTALAKEEDRQLFIEDQVTRMREAVAAWSYYTIAVSDDALLERLGAGR